MNYLHCVACQAHYPLLSRWKYPFNSTHMPNSESQDHSRHSIMNLLWVSILVCCRGLISLFWTFHVSPYCWDVQWNIVELSGRNCVKKRIYCPNNNIHPNYWGPEMYAIERGLNKFLAICLILFINDYIFTNRVQITAIDFQFWIYENLTNLLLSFILVSLLKN